jgi:hypothetical protein
MILLHDFPNSGGAVIHFWGGVVCNDRIRFISDNAGALILFGGTCL